MPPKIFSVANLIYINTRGKKYKEEFMMADWDFTCDLEGEELAEAMTYRNSEREYIEQEKRKIAKAKAQKLKEEK